MSHIALKKTALGGLLACFFIVSFVSESISAQNYLDYRIKLDIVGGDYEHAKITITKNGVLLKVIDSKPKYDIYLDLGAEYEITATKMGYITKSVLVNTKVPMEVADDDFGKFVSIIILKPQPSEDMEVRYTQPVAKVEFVNAKEGFDISKKYDAEIKEMQKHAEANPRKIVKTKKDSISHNQEKTNNTSVAYHPESNISQNTISTETSAVVSMTRNVEERTVLKERLKITFRILTINGVVIVYRKEEHSWGGVYFYKNDKNITENSFEKDTK